MARAPSHGFALLQLAHFLAERNPNPEPGDHLDEHKGEEDAVLEVVTAPRGRGIGRVVRVRGGMVGEAVARRRVVQGRGGTEQEGVDEEEQGDEEADGRWRWMR